MDMTESKNISERGAAYVIPTRTKYKIAHTLSWPIGAEQISRALGTVTQLNELVLYFRNGFREEEKRRGGIYRLICISYVAPNTSAPYGAYIPLHNRWEISVGPVPRTLRHKMHEYILSSALPAIRDWLSARSTLDMGGSEHLTFFYNDKSEQFYSQTDELLMPLRTRP